MTAFFARRAGALLSAAAFGALLTAAGTASAFDCSSPNPADWPPPSKPYFMIAFDTSGSMISCTNPTGASSNWPDSCPNTATPNSCGLEPTRLNDAKCAMRQTIQAFAGQVNFGLTTYGQRLSGCSNGTVTDSCTVQNCNAPEDAEYYSGRGCSISPPPDGNRCGNLPDCAGANATIYNGATIDGSSVPPVLGGGSVTLPNEDWRNGGAVVVDMLKDTTWSPATQPATNVPELLQWFDGRTDGSREVFAAGNTPLEGILRTVHQYYAAGWSSSWADDNYCATGGPAIDHPSPIEPANDRSCRSLNVILVTDGDETCSGTPANAALALYKMGVVIGGVRVPIRTHVIGFAGASAGALNPIADAGDDGNGSNGSETALFANNEVELAQALSAIIAGSVRPEVCDNTDNNCNGCFDEGHKKYCNRNKTGRAVAYLQNAANNPGPDDCCNAARATCLQNFANSITASKPQGDKFWLPCWDPVATPANPQTNWLCTDPAESCDDADNNCELEIDNTKPAFSTNVVDENQLKCGTPLRCPQAETCDNSDQNCDGLIDNASGSGVPFSACPNNCQPSPELCNGCDDDCDGVADDGIANVPCGFSPPAQCLGSRTCTPVNVAAPGACIPGVSQPGVNRYGACSATGAQETCNGIDDDCDGVVDDNVTGEGQTCTPSPGDPTVGACEAGRRSCQNGAFACVGYVGPSTEICDGIDNDCDGLIDGQDPNLVGVGQVCGSAAGQCLKGQTACVAGTIVCQGGRQPTPEICNGLDDDCNGVTDDALTDAPPVASCWSSTGTCNPQCAAAGATWCPPAGGTCTGLGTLVGACKVGGLVCDGVNRWICRGDQGPVAELCNGVDDDCDGVVDDNLGPPIGDVCGQTIPNTPCRAGVLICVNGTRVCDGQVPPQTELCNGIDDDCDGTIDNGVGVGAACRPEYDRTLYPGPDRQGPECPPGRLECDGSGAQTCAGGKGPQPEVCDGKDNDCDGQIDESGAAPDGIDGSANPEDSTQVLGANCGSQNACTSGKYGCVNGRVVCTGSSTVQPEICDCLDNDCDGRIDEDVDPNDPNGQPLCSEGKTCVENDGACQCAERCGSGEFPCPAGQRCELVEQSGVPENTGRFCLASACTGDCATKTVTRTDGTVECAPEGSVQGASRPIPECVCKGSAGCHEPCFNAGSCPSGQACAPLTGECQATGNCFFFGCPTGEVCTANRACVDNPCAPNPCEANEVCRPSADFSTANCVPTCAGVTCGSGEACVDGECKATGCSTTCATGQFCLPSGDCGPSQCSPDGCQQGEYCEPTTGVCGVNPCEGVACPSGQACKSGQCVTAETPPDPGPDGGAGGSGNGGSNGSGATSGSGATPGSGAKPGEEKKGVFGLATGGGGCACSVPARENNQAIPAALAAAALALAFGARRRTRVGARAEGGGR